MTSLTDEAQASPAAKTASPPATTGIVPMRAASRGPITLASAIDVATGSSRTPVPKAV